MGIDIIGAPIIREADRLAMSLWNMYLSADQRWRAACLSPILTAFRQSVKEGGTLAGAIINTHSETAIDCITICDPLTLDDVPVANRPVLKASAGKVGKARLIDNVIAHPNS